MDAREAYDDAAALCEEQAAVFEWQAGRAHALPDDLSTARMLRALAMRIRARQTEHAGETAIASDRDSGPGEPTSA
jgi:hypothetical protein